MTQRRVDNTRVHFWTFSPVSLNNTIPVVMTVSDERYLARRNFLELADWKNLQRTSRNLFLLQKYHSPFLE